MNTVAVAPIRSEADYEAGIARIAELMDAEEGSSEADELEILSLLVERFEHAAYPISAPTPLEAIRFRMEQQGLTGRDLEPILGSRSRVSEVLSGTRQLSIDMIRALNRHIGIPADVLLGNGDDEPRRPKLTKSTEDRLVSWGFLRNGEDFMGMLERALGGRPALAMLRQTHSDRTNAKTDRNAMQAWCASALLHASELPVDGIFHAASLGGRMRDVAKLSALEEGPAKVSKTLSELGIAFVTLPPLPGTHLDGAAMLRQDGVPVVALSLRRDQVDAFWFTLLHELAHVWKHLGATRPAIVDDLDIGSSTVIEREADRIAEGALIPAAMWDAFDKGEYTSRADVERLARMAGVHAGIVAARWRHLNRNYQRFSKLLGHRTVRPQFPDWVRLAGQ